MIQKLLFLTAIAVVTCQYPQQRAPPLRHRPPPEEYEDYDAPPPRQVPPPRQAPPPVMNRPNPRQSDLLRPASVHYVNIGLELAGDYKFGYDTGKGNDGQSFREETRLPDGTVQGAYGYVDETGTQRIVKYTAGKDGFKVVGDGASEAVSKNTPRSAPAPQQAYRPSPAAAQPAYRPPPAAAQPAYVPQPAPRPQPQPAYRPPPPTQPAYRPPPPTQPAYRPPPPQPQPAYRAPPAQPAYRAQAPRPQRPPARPVETYEEEPDYDYPNNDIAERRLVPVDTTLFNYNIGSSHS